MNTPTRLFLTLLALLSLLGSAACGSAPEPSALPSNTPLPPTNTQAPTDTPMPTATPLPTDTPTPTATATNTPTPKPTATPQGYLVNGEIGVSLITPPGWQVFQNDESSLSVTNDSRGHFFIMVGSPYTGEEISNAEMSDAFISGSFGEQGNIVAEEEFNIQVSGQEVPALLRQVQLSNGGIDILVAIIFDGDRFYTLIVITREESYKADQPTFDRLYKTIHLFTPGLEGIDLSQTLSLLGGNPTEDDLDPARTKSGASGYAGTLFSGLVRLNPQLSIEADLAESYTISPDGLIYTFTLRPGLKFSDGSPLDAQAVADSLDRALDPETESSTARTYLGDILGAKERLDGDADTVSGIRVVDERTLELTLDGPKPYFLAKLTYPSSFVVKVTQTRIDPNWMYRPVTSGLYQIKKYVENQSLILERNPEYYAQARIPFISYIFYPGGSAFSLYESGKLDMTYLPSDLALEIRRSEHALHAELQTQPQLCTTMVQMNNTRPPFDDLNVRKAFSLAVDSFRLAELLTNNLDIVAQGVLPPGMPGAQVDLPEPIFDAQAAAQALAASAYAGDLPEIVLLVSGYPGEERDDVKALAEMWRSALGVTVKVEQVEPENLTEAARSSEAHLVIYGWCADYPDPENFLDVLYHTDSDFNVARYSNPEVDELLEAARTEFDPNLRLSFYNQAEDLLVEDYALIPLLHSVADQLVKPHIKGYSLGAMGVNQFAWMYLEGKK